MIIEEQPTLTDIRKFTVKEGDKHYLVFLPGVFNSLPVLVYELKDISGTRKGAEIALEVAQRR